MGILKSTVKASTLIEVLIAMVIIMASTGIGLMIYQNLSRDNKDELKIKAEIQLNSFASETKIKNDFTDITLEREDMHIQRTVEIFEKSKRLRILHIEAFTPLGIKITEYKEIVLKP